MNEQANHQLSTSVEDATRAEIPSITNPKPKRVRTDPRAPRNARGRNSPPETQTPERRLELTKAAARKLAREQKIRIPLRLGVSLEMHEGMVAIAEKIGGAKIPDVALRCM